VDLPAGISDHSLAVMDLADQIVIMAALEIGHQEPSPVHEVADQLGSRAVKLRIVMNRAASQPGIRLGDVEARSADRSTYDRLRWEARRLAVNRGVPSSSPTRKARCRGT
jgi:hypothetical protein